MVGLMVLATTAVRPVLAQSAPTGIGGVVLDPNDQTVANAAVVMRNVSTNRIQTTTTDGSGRFSIGDLPAGVYAIEVIAPGFATAPRDGVEVAAGNAATRSAVNR